MATPQSREQPYDPYIPAGGSAAAGNSAQDGGNQRTAALQAVSSESPTISLLCIDMQLPLGAAAMRRNDPQASAAVDRTLTKLGLCLAHGNILFSLASLDNLGPWLVCMIPGY